VHLSVIFAVN